jgi:NAD(P)-dependent dehydrogenase (short-subunit alcohol dehydrogenase family)
MRAYRGGAIVNTPRGARVDLSPVIGMYSPSKWELESVSYAFAKEVALFGIRVLRIL